jgi:hypothetical protein
MRIAMVAVAIVVVSSSSHASPSCMTQAEARQKFGTAHLYWHGPGHCWDATPSRRRLAQRAKTPERQQVERDAVQEKKPPQEAKPTRWAHEPRWREAMSKMLSDDVAAVRSPARAQADSEPVEAPSTRWRDRWVDVAQRVPPIVDKSEPADLTPATARNVEPVAAEPLVTPTRVMLAFLAVLLTLAVIEIVFRSTIREWRR